MTRSVFRRGVGALLLTVVLGLPGVAAAEAVSSVLSVTGLGAALWDLFTGAFLEDETTPPADGTGTGGDTSNGGGAMDPNGGGGTGGTGGTPPPPPYP
jgi:hypothetical protein